MVLKHAKIRLFVDAKLGQGQSVALSQDQAHYLFGVMRQNKGGLVALFNGIDGEWQAEITESGKRKGTLQCLVQSKSQQDPPDLWLVFAPIKKARTDFIVEKATEMGAAKILPVQTQFTNADRIRQDRLQAHAVEASEQCGGTFVPEVTALTKLDKVLQSWPEDRHILFCDETKVGDTPTDLTALPKGKWAIFIGPEGGFSPDETTRLRAHPQATAISLGPRILRADTAAVAALTLWQSALGDWT